MAMGKCDDEIQVNFLADPIDSLSVGVYDRYHGTLRRGTFLYIIQGEHDLLLNGVEYHAVRGQMFLMPYETWKAAFPNEPDVKQMCDAHFDLFCSDTSVMKLLTEVHTIQVPEEERHIPHSFILDIAKYQNASLLSDRLLHKALILHLLAYFIGFIALTDSEIMQVNKMQPVISYIENNLEKKITIEKLSQIVRLHPNYFFRYFKNAMGVTPIEYINSLRVQRAKEILLSDVPIRSVAAQCGFQSEYYFSRFFREKMGMTPSEFRLKMQEEQDESEEL